MQRKSTKNPFVKRARAQMRNKYDNNDRKRKQLLRRTGHETGLLFTYLLNNNLKKIHIGIY